MGNSCCTKDTLEGDQGDFYGGRNNDFHDTQLRANKMTARQLALLIKVQARVRGLITRNKIRQSHGYGNMLNDPDYGQMVEMGMGQEYENPKVQEISEKLGEFEYGTVGMPAGG